jgi:uncharacterized membrane protein YpjA
MSRIQIFSITGAIFFLLLILEMVRRRLLRAQYSLLWLFAGLALLAFGLWRSLVDIVGQMLGIYYTPTALLLVFIFFFMVMLLHFSTVISQLTEQNRILAQRFALQEWRIEQDCLKRE